MEKTSQKVNPEEVLQSLNETMKNFYLKLPGNGHEVEVELPDRVVEVDKTRVLASSPNGSLYLRMKKRVISWRKGNGK